MFMRQETGMFHIPQMRQEFSERLPGIKVLANMPDTLEMYIDMLNHLAQNGRAICSVTGLANAGKDTIIGEMDALTRVNPHVLKPFLLEDTYHYLKDYHKKLRRMHYSFSTTARAAKLSRAQLGYPDFYPGMDPLVDPNTEPGAYRHFKYRVISELGGIFAHELSQEPYDLENPLISWFQGSSLTVRFKTNRLQTEEGLVLREEDYLLEHRQFFHRIQSQLAGNDRWASVLYFLAHYPYTAPDTFSLAVVRDPEMEKQVLPRRRILTKADTDDGVKKLNDNDITVRVSMTPDKANYKEEQEALDPEQVAWITKFLPRSMMPVEGAMRADRNLKAMLRIGINDELTAAIQESYYEYMLEVGGIDRNLGGGTPYAVIEMNPYQKGRRNNRFMQMYQDDVVARRLKLIF